jgi:hypothetical protein
MILFPMSYVETVMLPVMNARGQDLFGTTRPKWQPVTKGRFLRFIGYIMLMAMCPNTGSRQNLWAQSHSRRESDPSAPAADDADLFVPQDFGRHGFSRHRFDQIMSALVFVAPGANPDDDPQNSLP